MFDNAVDLLNLVCRFLVEVGLLGERRPQFDVVVDAGGGQEGRRRVRLHAVHHVLETEQRSSYFCSSCALLAKNEVICHATFDHVNYCENLLSLFHCFIRRKLTIYQ